MNKHQDFVYDAIMPDAKLQLYFDNGHYYSYELRRYCIQCKTTAMGFKPDIIPKHGETLVIEHSHIPNPKDTNHYFDVSQQKLVPKESMQVRVNHYPQKGEWEQLKTLDDVRESNLVGAVV